MLPRALLQLGEQPTLLPPQLQLSPQPVSLQVAMVAMAVERAAMVERVEMVEMVEMARQLIPLRLLPVNQPITQGLKDLKDLGLSPKKSYPSSRPSSNLQNQLWAVPYHQ
jgi:hypothetical protein